MKVYGHLDINLDTIDECNIAHLYQCLKKDDLNPSPGLDDDVLLDDYARQFRDYVNSEQVNTREWPYHPMGYLSEDNLSLAASERLSSDDDTEGGFSRRTMRDDPSEVNASDQKPSSPGEDIIDLLTDVAVSGSKKTSKRKYTTEAKTPRQFNDFNMG